MLLLPPLLTKRRIPPNIISRIPFRHTHPRTQTNLNTRGALKTQLGDHTIRLDYDGTNALYLPTTTEGSSSSLSSEEPASAVRSKYDEDIDADPTLPPVWSPDTLGARVSITIAGDVTPTVVSVSCPLTPGGVAYGVGEVIDLEVLFTTRVYVKNSISLPYLLVETGEDRRGDAQVCHGYQGGGGGYSCVGGVAIAKHPPFRSGGTARSCSYKKDPPNTHVGARVMTGDQKLLVEEEEGDTDLFCTSFRLMK